MGAIISKIRLLSPRIAHKITNNKDYLHLVMIMDYSNQQHKGHHVNLKTVAKCFDSVQLPN